MSRSSTPCRERQQLSHERGRTHSRQQCGQNTSCPLCAVKRDADSDTTITSNVISNTVVLYRTVVLLQGCTARAGLYCSFHRDDQPLKATSGTVVQKCSWLGTLFAVSCLSTPTTTPSEAPRQDNTTRITTSENKCGQR